MAILEDISLNLQRGKAKVVKELVQQAVDQGIDAKQILEEGLLAGMGIVGEKFKNNEVFVPEVLVAARAMNMGGSILKPLLTSAHVEAKGRACIGTVVQTAKEQNCQIICCSALLTTTMGVMGDVVKAAENAGIRDQVKIMVGGAPITQSFCDEIGADVYTSDAASAADAAIELCAK